MRVVPPSVRDRRVARVMLVLLGDIRKRYSRAEAAEVAHLEPAYFSRRFREVVGLTYSQWCTKMRLDTATELLAKSDLSISEVACAVGYHDVTTFERNFRRHAGFSPRAYRSCMISPTRRLAKP